MSSLAWIGVALFFSWRALERWRPAALAGAAFGCAMVVSNNFYGATALAMLFPVLLWSLYITHLDRLIWVRAAAIGVLAYGLTAFWLIPSYIRITLANMQFVSAEGNLWSRWVALGYLILFLLLSDKFARGVRHRAWMTFVVGAFSLFVINILGNHYLDFRIIGEPSRLVPELDLLALILAIELLRRLWSHEGRWKRARVGIAAACFVAMLVPSWPYISRAHKFFVPSDHRYRVEYELTEWIANNLPGSRALPAGSVRFWYDTWRDLPQVGGGSEQGLLNPRVLPPQWQTFLGPEGDMSLMWMQLMGADAVIVNGRDSREPYKDHVYPDKFKGIAPVLYDNGKGDVIYGVPRRFKSLARVIDRAHHSKLPWIPGNGEMPQLQAWHDVVEKGAISEAPMQRQGTDAFTVRATVSEGQSIWIQESYDTNWRAYSGDHQLPIREDSLGFMVVDAPPGTHNIRFEFPVPLVNILGRIVTVLSMAAVVALIWIGRSR